MERDTLYFSTEFILIKDNSWMMKWVKSLPYHNSDKIIQNLTINGGAYVAGSLEMMKLLNLFFKFYSIHMLTNTKQQITDQALIIYLVYMVISIMNQSNILLMMKMSIIV
jgi:hypothetical protein